MSFCSDLTGGAAPPLVWHLFGSSYRRGRLEVLRKSPSDTSWCRSGLWGLWGCGKHPVGGGEWDAEIPIIPGSLMQKLTWLVTPLTNHVSYKWGPILQVVFATGVAHCCLSPSNIFQHSSSSQRLLIDRMVCWDSTGCELASWSQRPKRTVVFQTPFLGAMLVFRDVFFGGMVSILMIST